MATEVTVGIDIGTTSVKAVAADADGRVVATSRIPHGLHASHAGELAHDARQAWHDGVRAALAAVVDSGDLEVVAVDVAAMVPSLCAVDVDGVPISDGLLYGDARGAGGDLEADPSQSGELVRFLGWLVREHPDAAGYWPAQAVANAALSGEGAIETTVAMTTLPLFDFQGWDPAVAASAGLADVDKLPRIVVGADPVGKVDSVGGAPLGGGTIDALGEQLVAGADEDGDVLVILGSTLIVWAVIADWREVDGVWTVPHTAPGKVLIGGPSNAGGLFLNWVDRLLGPAGDDRGRLGALPSDPSRVPVWQPYLRGERVPFHDPGRRASLHDLDIGHDASAVRRAAYEASGFATRHLLDLGEVDPRRIVATGGGVRDSAWVQALADATGLPVDVVAVPEGGALGTAWLARVTAGLEPLGSSATGWVRSDRRVEPDPRVRRRDGALRPVPGAGRVTEPASDQTGRSEPASDHANARDVQAMPAAGPVRFTVISVDDHLVEPRHLFDGRVPAAMADRAPFVRRTSKDHEIWVFDGHAYPQVGLNAVVGRSKDDSPMEPVRFDQIRKGCWDPDARLADMDLAGIWASVNFPSQITGFCGTVYSQCSDPDLGQACVRAWNDWFHEEWWSPHPERFVPMGITYLADPDVGAAEIRRNAARGFRAVSLPEQPHRLGFPSLHSGWWDPVLRACVDTGTVVCLHVGSSGMMSEQALDGPLVEMAATLFSSMSLTACVDWLWSFVPLRFPDLKIAMSEGGIGWVPMLADRLDYVHGWSGLGKQAWPSTDLTPTEVLLRNFWFCSLDDPSIWPIRERIGVDHIMVEVDYPHADSTWPETQDFLAGRLAGLPVDEQRLVCHANAAELFHHPLPDDPLPALAPREG